MSKIHLTCAKSGWHPPGQCPPPLRLRLQITERGGVCSLRRAEPPFRTPGWPLPLSKVPCRNRHSVLTAFGKMMVEERAASPEDCFEQRAVIPVDGEGPQGHPDPVEPEAQLSLEAGVVLEVTVRWPADRPCRRATCRLR